MNQLVYPILGDSVCQDLWNEWYFPDTEICAGYQSEGKDFCGVSQLVPVCIGFCSLQILILL